MKYFLPLLLLCIGCIHKGIILEQTYPVERVAIRVWKGHDNSLEHASKMAQEYCGQTDIIFEKRELNQMAAGGFTFIFTSIMYDDFYDYFFLCNKTRHDTR